MQGAGVTGAFATSGVVVFTDATSAGATTDGGMGVTTHCCCCWQSPVVVSTVAARKLESPALLPCCPWVLLDCRFT